MMKNLKLTPWLNEGLFGFFEYDCWYKGIHTHARTLEDLQTVTTNTLKELNESVKTAKKTENFTEKYEKLSDEEKNSISLVGYFNQLNQRELTEEECEEIRDKLYDEEIVITENPECVIQHFDPTAEDLKELEDILTQYPDISQIELENIYYHHCTTDPNSMIYLNSVSNAKEITERYDSDLEISALLCSMYEKMLECEAQLVNSSEEIVNLYEEKEDLKNETI